MKDGKDRPTKSTCRHFRTDFTSISRSHLRAEQEHDTATGSIGNLMEDLARGVTKAVQNYEENMLSHSIWVNSQAFGVFGPSHIEQVSITSQDTPTGT